MNEINQDKNGPETTEQVETSAQPETPNAAETSPADADTIAELEGKLKQTHERLLRTAADLDNFRKRAKREAEDALQRGRSEVLQELLPVLDSIELALGTKDTEGANESIIEGVQMIKKQFMTAAERFGLSEVESRGKSFDPNFHEAVAQIESMAHPAGQIVDEMRKGYLLGEKLLRAAMVVVSKGAPPSGPSDEGGGSSSDRPKIDDTI